MLSAYNGGVEPLTVRFRSFPRTGSVFIDREKKIELCPNIVEANHHLRLCRLGSPSQILLAVHD